MAFVALDSLGVSRGIRAGTRIGCGQLFKLVLESRLVVCDRARFPLADCLHPTAQTLANDQETLSRRRSEA